MSSVVADEMTTFSPFSTTTLSDPLLIPVDASPLGLQSPSSTDLLSRIAVVNVKLASASFSPPLASLKKEISYASLVYSSTPIADSSLHAPILTAPVITHASDFLLNPSPLKGSAATASVSTYSGVLSRIKLDTALRVSSVYALTLEEGYPVTLCGGKLLKIDKDRLFDTSRQQRSRVTNSVLLLLTVSSADDRLKFKAAWGSTDMNVKEAALLAAQNLESTLDVRLSIEERDVLQKPTLSSSYAQLASPAAPLCSRKTSNTFTVRIN